MASIYIHIPYCKQACFYCDFHFSTNNKNRDLMVQALVAELGLQQFILKNDCIDAIYFGGGTPSLLKYNELKLIIDAVFENYTVSNDVEITLEANPDDIDVDNLKMFKNIGINRLSIGIQSFREEDLKLMNRAHTAKEATKCLELACIYFKNISIDLIYGFPNMALSAWKTQIETALSFPITHLSSYALTVEPNTVLDHLIKKDKMAPLDEELAQSHFLFLVDYVTQKGFEHYEMSNFCKDKNYSKNNSGYWLGKKYIGIGPSAHSFYEDSRSWNIANNHLYTKSLLEKGQRNCEIEILSNNDMYNEYIMTGLRTKWGVSFDKIATFGNEYLSYVKQNIHPFIEKKWVIIEENHLRTTTEGLFFADGITRALFYT